MFSNIYFDSKICQDKFAKDFSNIELNKFNILYCMINDAEVRKKAEEQVCFDVNSSIVNIMTVGRISPEKGQDMIPDIIKFIKEAGYNIKWYLIGDGEDKDRIQNLAVKNGVSDMLVFLGSKKNPYPYMKKCDIYVQPSYSEAYSLAIIEALILGKPIVITNVAGATEILHNGVDSLIVPVDYVKIANAIISLIKDESKKASIIKALEGRDFTNYDIVKKIVERNL